jgi:hypothetical protein
MGLFDFMKKEEKKPERKEQKAAPAAPQVVKIFVESNDIPYFDPNPKANMEVKLCVRADFDFNSQPDEEAAKAAAIESFKYAFGKTSGQLPVSEFSKSVNTVAFRNSMMEYMREQGFDIKYVSIGFASYNKEYNELINHPRAY